MPGNPIQIKIDQLMDQRQMSYDDALRSAAALYDFDPDAPLMEQYVDYIVQAGAGRSGQLHSLSRDNRLLPRSGAICPGRCSVSASG